MEDLARCAELHAGAIGVGGATELNDAFVKAAADANIEIWRWTVDDPAEMQAMLDLPVRGLISNRPNVALGLAE
jgi:glycerophosphoryl diester phosphodiesterase